MRYSILREYYFLLIFLEMKEDLKKKKTVIDTNLNSVENISKRSLSSPDPTAFY